MSNRRRISALCLLIVFLGGLCGVQAEDSGIRSPFSGRAIRDVQDKDTVDTTSSDVSNGQSVTPGGMGTGEDWQTKLKDIQQKTVTLIIKTLRTIIDLLKRLIEMLKQLLIGKSAPQAPETTGTAPTTTVPADNPADEPAQVTDTASVQAPEPAPETEPIVEPAPEPSPDPSTEQPPVTDPPVTAEPAAEPVAEPSDDSSVPPAPTEIRRGPSPAECEQMRLLILDGKVEAAAAMLDKGFDPNARIGDKGTPLHYAAEAGQKGIVELLLKRGADLGSRGERNIAPLHVAAATKNVEICRMMIAAGADVNITGWDAAEGSDRTPLHVATELGALDVVKLLIASGATVNALDSRKQTPLFWAIMSGQTEAAAILRENGGVTDPSKIPTPATTVTPAP